MRKLALLTAAALAAVFLLLAATLPPRPATVALDAVDPELRRRTVAGAYHIHTTRSDGAGSKADVAAAAARAGLAFAIFTDHGDGIPPPDPPTYLEGVLCIDGIEISTNGGHYVALDMAKPPYPLGGEASAVVEDVTRLGGFGIAAHPDHPTRELAWSDWNAPFNGLEWINSDAEWRDERSVKLARVLFDYLLRPGPALASVFDRPSLTLDRWDSLEKGRPVVALAAVDAHGGARVRARGEGREPWGIGPSYEASFRSLTNRVILERPLSGDAAADARLVLDALRSGRAYSVVDAVSSDVVLNLSADEPFHLVSPLPAGAQPFTFQQADRRRLEVHASNAPGNPPVPWIVSNWAGPRDPQPVRGSESTIVGETTPLPLGSEWRLEKDPVSSGRVSSAGDVAALEYRLRADARASQYAAAAADLRDPAGISRIVFRGRATKPMRVSVQLRFSPDDARWTKSVYLEPQEREVIVELGSMVPAERSSAAMPQISAARSILFVVDLVNAPPGDNGAFTISALRGAR